MVRETVEDTSTDQGIDPAKVDAVLDELGVGLDSDLISILQNVQERLGWLPARSTPEMFAESYAWFLQNRAATTSATASHHRRSTRQGALAAAKRLTGVLPEAG